MRAPADLPDTALPAPGGVLAAIYQRQTLRVGVGDTMPYAFRNDRGQLVGFDVEMAQQLAGDLGVALPSSSASIRPTSKPRCGAARWTS